MVSSDYTEKTIKKYFQEEGYNHFKVCNRNIYRVKKKLKKQLKFEKGFPDFFVWNKEEKFLCEFKSKNDTLSNSQIIWALKNDVPLKWILATNNEDNYNKDILYMASEFKEENKKLRYTWNLKHSYLNKYLENNKKTY